MVRAAAGLAFEKARARAFPVQQLQEGIFKSTERARLCTTARARAQDAVVFVHLSYCSARHFCAFCWKRKQNKGPMGYDDFSSLFNGLTKG